jgi:hypothetical protein
MKCQRCKTDQTKEDYLSTRGYNMKNFQIMEIKLNPIKQTLNDAMDSINNMICYNTELSFIEMNSHMLQYYLFSRRNNFPYFNIIYIKIKVIGL